MDFFSTQLSSWKSLHNFHLFFFILDVFVTFKTIKYQLNRGDGWNRDTVPQSSLKLSYKLVVWFVNYLYWLKKKINWMYRILLSVGRWQDWFIPSKSYITPTSFKYIIWICIHLQSDEPNKLPSLLCLPILPSFQMKRLDV